TSRAPIRIGAEFYGHAGVKCDIEVICLMCAMLQQAGVENVHLVLGHVGIYRSLLEEAGMNPESEETLFEAVQRKAYGEVDRLLAAGVGDGALREMLARLVRLSGGGEALKQAQETFAGAPAAVKAELDELLAIDEGVRKRVPAVPLSYDLCELRGYQYHTGIVFAAYTPGYGRAVAKGGRYDNIGEVFGRARPATGFDSDLKTLARLTGREFLRQPGILAPDSDCAELRAKVERLRASGEIVICDVNGGCDAAAARDLGCDRLLLRGGDEWLVEKI
ncbi:MAG: ATP phosphoribosyltransferase regulatory subunit, partial [Gammaproteobacteria bacterium]|nr:ATP phosphoribosyltransferase regulatory subunit [Gammaproteobacteria bacterium]